MNGCRVQVRISRLEGFDPDVPLPSFGTSGSAGADVRANLPEGDRASGLTIPERELRLVPLGLAMAIPSGHEGQIRSRSGLALKHGIFVLNSPGTVDSDYRGPVGVILFNLGASAYTVRHGDRIAQLVIAQVVRAGFAEINHLDGTQRGAGGFGSTGVD